MKAGSVFGNFVGWFRRQASSGMEVLPKGPKMIAHRGSVDLEDEAKSLFGVLSPRLQQGSGLVLQFVSATPGEGVSTIARDFAVVASRYTEGRVVLLELGAREGEHARFFQGERQQNRYGSLRAIEDWDIDSSALMLTPCDQEPYRMEFKAVGKSSLVVGWHSGSSVDLIYGPGANQFWASIRQKSVLCIVDSSSLPAGLDAATLGRDMDAVLIVVAAESTRAPVVDALTEKLRLQEAPVAGMILNKRRFYIPAYMYRWLSNF